MPPVNNAFSLGGHGMLHCFGSHGSNFTLLRHECAKTSYRATYKNPERLFSGDMLKALFQTDDQGERQIVKGVDGHVAIVRTANGEKRIQAFIRDPVVCHPEAMQGDLSQGTVHLYVVAEKPGQQRIPFLLQEGHGGVLPAEHVSLHGPMDHMVSNVAAAIPLGYNDPRIIFNSPNLGVLKGTMLRGKTAHLVKTGFMRLIKQTSGVGMYDAPIEISQAMSDALMLNNPAGQVCITKLKNGILGYRARKDGGKTFTFVANSQDFFDDEPTQDIRQSTMQLFKMTYADKKPTGHRISIQITGKEYSEIPCKYNTPLIRLNMTVQDVLNIIEFACRNAMLDHLDCGDYPDEWNAHGDPELQDNDSMVRMMGG